MYSLLMVSASGYWDKGGASFDLSRYLEYTDDALKEQLRPITVEVIEKLKSWPVLFAYELPVYDLETEDVARVGWLTLIQVRKHEVRLAFEFDNAVPPISAQELKTILWDLDIERETHRTHWAVKDIDLFEVLRKAKILVDLPAQVRSPELEINSETVERALEDAEHLIVHGRGASSALDRVHTVLHGYLVQLCLQEGLIADPTDRPTMTAAFKKLREEHPKFVYAGPRESEIGSVLKFSAALVEGFNTLRNNASVAHPNEAVVPEPEAMYLVNVARSLLHYIEMKRAQ